MQHIYLFYKHTNKLDLLQSLALPTVINNQVYTTTSNQFG